MSRCSCWATSRGRSSRSANATARSSAATRSSSRNRPRRALTPRPGASTAGRRGRARGGLRNAATAEFLVTPDGRVWFLEVNARLQVEHGVTELVTGLDLVPEQLWIAAGRPLSEAGSPPRRARHPDRHAIEVRLTAEDPARAFAPAPGRVGRWDAGGPGRPRRHGVRPGDRIPPDYDPLIAKIMTVGPDRRLGARQDGAGARGGRGHRDPDDDPIRHRPGTVRCRMGSSSGCR